MALQVASGSFNAGTGAATTTYNVTSGFRPDVILFFSGPATTSTDTAGSNFSDRQLIGWWANDGTSEVQRAVAYRSGDTAPTSQVTGGMRTDAAIAVMDDNAWNGWHKVRPIANWPSDGFAMEVVDALTLDARVHYLALEGTSSDLTNIAVGTIASPTASGNQDTTTGFQPDLLILAGVPTSVAFSSGGSLGTNGTGSALSFGIAARSGAGTISQAVVMGGADDAAANMITAGHARTGGLYAMMGTSDTVDTIQRHANLNSMLSTGFRLAWTVEGATSPWHIFYLAIKGLRAAVGDFVTSGTSSASITETGVGFQPVSLLIASACAPADATATTVTASRRWCMGTATGSGNQRCASGMDADTLSASDTSGANHHGRLYASVRRTGSEVVVHEGHVTLNSFDSDGFSATQTTGDTARGGGSAANYVAYLAIASAVAALSISAEAGTIATSGQAALFHTTMVAGGGSVALAGQDATLAKGYTIAADSGTWASTGTAADLRLAALLAADSGAFTLAGQDATLALGRLFAADAGSVTIQGTAAELTHGEGVVWEGVYRGLLALTTHVQVEANIIDALTGLITLSAPDATLQFTNRVFTAEGGTAASTSGSDVTFLLGRVLPCAAGTVDLAGQVATLTKTGQLGIPAESGSFTLAGTDATLLRSVVLPAESGTVSLDGQAVTFLQSRVFVADGGTVTIAGQDATLSNVRAFSIDALTGAFSSAGTAADLRGAFLIDAQPASVTLAGSASSLLLGLRLDAGSGAVTTGGTEAVLALGRELAALGDTVLLSGHEATLAAGRLLSASAGASSLLGQAASLLRTGSYGITGESGEIALLGQQAAVVAGWRITALSESYSILGGPGVLSHTRAIVPIPGQIVLTGPLASLVWSGEAVSRVSVPGSYTPVIALSASYAGTMSLSGSYAPTDALDGSM